MLSEDRPVHQENPVHQGKKEKMRSTCINGASMLRIFRENEVCNFYFNTVDDGIIEKGGKGIGLKDRLGKRNAI